ncbi:MAG: toll/interleukin-1 receptor domain-containing protein [Hyphomicrobiales bacterium]|nr:toll/interleukin-1 receptor domain-containing protein [Hyphomicrobiales bacterium]
MEEAGVGEVDVETSGIVGPLVFVSHDSRDAELAEAFCKLLSTVSAGMLKTFRSSDKKGSQGFEFGAEWYPELMRNLDAACDVVCLLTTRSLGRPWILYEAGVAKGKIDAPVHGLALGVSLSSASTGPFAQFQNCDDEADSLAKLVVQLVKRLPSADPDPEMITAQVEAFRDRVSKILESQEDGDEVIEDDPAMATKLFEEIKVMFKDLPVRVENAAIAAGDGSPRRGLLDPRILDEFLMMSRHSGEGTSLLVAFSLFRDDLPWIYDLALEVYRCIRDGQIEAARRSWDDLERSLMDLSHGPGRMVLGRGREGTMLLDVADEWIHRFRPGFSDDIDGRLPDERPTKPR